MHISLLWFRRRVPGVYDISPWTIMCRGRCHHMFDLREKLKPERPRVLRRWCSYWVVSLSLCSNSWPSSGLFLSISFLVRLYAPGSESTWNCLILVMWLYSSVRFISTVLHPIWPISKVIFAHPIISVGTVSCTQFASPFLAFFPSQDSTFTGLLSHWLATFHLGCPFNARG